MQKFSSKAANATTNITNNINLNIMIDNQRSALPGSTVNPRRNSSNRMTNTSEQFSRTTNKKTADKKLGNSMNKQNNPGSMIAPPKLEQPLVKLKIKRTSKQLNSDKREVFDVINTFKALKKANPYSQIEGRYTNQNGTTALDIKEILRSEEHHDYSKTLVGGGLNQDEYNEYHAMGNNMHGSQSQEDEDHQEIGEIQFTNDAVQYQINDEVKIPSFLNRGQNDKNQFYMTQIINHSKALQAKNSKAYNPQGKNGSFVSASIKQSKSQLKGSINNKKSSSQLINKSQIVKSLKKKSEISPIGQTAKNTNFNPDHYINPHEFTSYSVLHKSQKQNNRRDLNASAVLVASSKDVLNSTAPLNLTQLHKMYHEEALHAIGFSDAVNSTQNLKKLPSKESWGDFKTGGSNAQALQNIQNYYNGLNKKRKSNSKALNSTQQSVSPNKEQRNKNMLIQSILNSQDISSKHDKKFFLNLTLQQLINQQKNQVDSSLGNEESVEVKIKKNQKGGKRLNKTLEHFRENNSTYYNSNENQNKKIYANNFIQGGQQYNQFNMPKNVSKSTSKNKFINTALVSDFNQTQLIETKSSYSNKKQKSSFKSTQNINFQEEIGALKKGSALSTYSMNTALPTTSHQTQTKNRKLVNSKLGIQISNSNNIEGQSAGSKAKHKKQNSIDKKGINNMMNFYQDETISKFITHDAKNKTYSSAIKAHNFYQMPQNQKQVSGIQHYLYNNSNPPKAKLSFIATQMSVPKKEKASLNNSYVLMGTRASGKLVQNQNQSELDNYNPVSDLVQEIKQQMPRNQKEENQNQALAYPNKQIRDFKQQINAKQEYSNTNNPYTVKKSLTQMKKEKKELQNKTQPIPKQILEMAQAEVANTFSSGNSIIIQNKQQQQSKESKSSIPKIYKQQQVKQQRKEEEAVIKPKVGKRKEIEIAKVQAKDENPSDIYNNKNTVILDEIPSQQAFKDQDQSTDSSAQKLDKYILGKQLGQGAYAIVRVATLKKNNTKYAIKIYDKSKLTDTNRQRSVRREIKLLQKMNHQNIVKIYEAFETDDHVYLVMDYVGGGSLHSYLKEKPNRRLQEDDAKRIFKQLLTALQYCHRKSIAHRDIKLENILLDENMNVKLIDFGFSTCIPNDKKIKMFCGTPSYMAPEIVLKEEYAGPPADIWASGVLLYALMNGCFPFRGATDKELYRRIQRGTFDMQNQKVTVQLLQFLQKMINVNADLRATSEELLQDEWFQSEGESMSSQSIANKESIQEQKKIFKAKILGKIPVEKNKNTICLVASNDKSKLNPQNLNLAQLNQHPNINQGSSNFRANINLQGNDFSDYGLQQNVMKRLNQEAYQAYYNTSGGNFNPNNAQHNSNLQNPYYNNFFNSNGNYQQHQNNPQMNMAFYPNVNNLGGTQQRGSPSKASSTGININTANPVFIPINFTQQPPNQIGTPQVFGSPTGFAYNHANPMKDQSATDNGVLSDNPSSYSNTNNNNNETSGYYIGAMNGTHLINLGANLFDQVQMSSNNNHPTYFNIINNITQVTCLPQPQVNDQQIKSSPFNTDNKQNDNYAQQTKVLQQYQPQQQQTQDLKVSDFDEEIIDSITQMGYHRSHVVSQLEHDTSSHISNIYSRMKDEKMSQTQNRPLSMQPYSRRPTNHNQAVFPPNFVPSIPDSMKAASGENNEAYYYKSKSRKEYHDFFAEEVAVKKVNVDEAYDKIQNSSELPLGASNQV